MRNFQTFQVFPTVPQPLSFLETLSQNLWWSWQHDAKELFRRVNPGLWEAARENPLRFATFIPQENLDRLAADKSFLAHLERVRQRYEQQILPHAHQFEAPHNTVAYFSMEFGIHESLPIFAGGLGVLAGDHLKAASDMGIPLVAVGLLYRQGYFRQYMDHEGWQQEEYPEINLYQLPMSRVKDSSGNEITVSVSGPRGKIYAAVWKVVVGRVPLFLLDTNIMDNPPEFRTYTARLYDAEGEIRMVQELILGIGGLRALEAVGIHPAVVHMNEGHSAFVSLERLAVCMKTHGVDLETALEIVPRTTIFTTHTPVAAGHDEFPAHLARPYLAPLEQALGVSANEILSWGQAKNGGSESPLSMFVLALRMAQYINGVSRLHGKTARAMWSHLWPEIPQEEVPITHVTNGVHSSSWVSPENAMLFEQYLGPDWQMRPSEPSVVDRVDAIYGGELWRAHEMSRTRLIRTCREIMLRQYGRRNAPISMMRDASSVLDQDILTIGFARRFATYKRAYLLFMDPDRLEALVTNPEKPVQIVLAGKAHPKDNEGKGLIQQLIRFARRPALRRHVIFLEDYDIQVARCLVQGADVWLNTPRIPLEACGTSGMKAALNGVLNLSVLDGWWAEGFDRNRGWAIGQGEEYSDHGYQDAVESQALFNVLENDVIPCFYDRKESDIPLRWVSMMKQSIKMALEHFSAHCMVGRYDELFYRQALENARNLCLEDAREAKEHKAKHRWLKEHWSAVRVEQPVREGTGLHRVGESFLVKTKVYLGQLKPSEVEVHLYYGLLQSMDTLVTGDIETMTVEKDHGGGFYTYACTVECKVAGRYGYTARVMPAGDSRIRFAPGLVTWA